MESITYATSEDSHWITHLDELTSTTPSALPLSAATVVELAAVTARAQAEMLARRGQRPDWSDAAKHSAVDRATAVATTAVFGAAAPDPQVADIVRDLVTRSIHAIWRPHLPVGRCRHFGDPLTVVDTDRGELRDAEPGEVRCSSDGCPYADEPLSSDPQP